MEIPGTAPFSGQPTVTNPLSSDSLLVGRETKAQNNTETQSTVTAREQAPSSTSTVEVVSQVDETSGTGFDANNSGTNLDVIV
ncbi:MAG: hypothetical protein COB23_00950 [Methylophaga sp.]|nr:MAG: hypothetical protein COB23_00950 [Methylophaga sp.]